MTVFRDSIVVPIWKMVENQIDLPLFVVGGSRKVFVIPVRLRSVKNRVVIVRIEGRLSIAVRFIIGIDINIRIFADSFSETCQKPHKLACGMNGILLEQGFLGDGESPNNRLLPNPTAGSIAVRRIWLWDCNLGLILDMS